MNEQPPASLARTRHVHLIVHRDTDAGLAVLLRWLPGPGDGAGLWQARGGQVDGPHEDMLTAAVRTVRQQSGVSVDPSGRAGCGDRSPPGPGRRSRTAYFVAVGCWKGEPQMVGRACEEGLQYRVRPRR